MCMHTFILNVGFERLKLFKDDLNHFLLVVLSRVLPRILI